LDGVDLRLNAIAGKVATYRTRDEFEWRGVHSTAKDRCNGANISVRHSQFNTDYTIEVRAFDYGVAVRYLLPDVGKTRVPDEATAFTVPAGSTVWYHDFVGHYEGTHVKKKIEDVKEGEWAAPPLTFLAR
jgi:alpha-glucosidase